MLLMWSDTVRGATVYHAAISLSVKPSAISWMTSISRCDKLLCGRIELDMGSYLPITITQLLRGRYCEKYGFSRPERTPSSLEVENIGMWPPA